MSLAPTALESTVTGTIVVINAIEHLSSPSRALERSGKTERSEAKDLRCGSAAASGRRRKRWSGSGALRSGGYGTKLERRTAILPLPLRSGAPVAFLSETNAPAFL